MLEVDAKKEKNTVNQREAQGTTCVDIPNNAEINPTFFGKDNNIFLHYYRQIVVFYAQPETKCSP